MSLRIRPLVHLASWGALTYGVLSLANIRADLGEKAICGPWGCLPPAQALIAAHGFWVMVLVPGVVLGARRLSRGRLRLVARLLIALGGLGLAAVVVHTLWAWGPATPRAHRWHPILRAAFEMAMLVDLPAVEALGAGLACLLIARRRMPGPRGPSAADAGGRGTRDTGEARGGLGSRVPFKFDLLRFLIKSTVVASTPFCVGCGGPASLTGGPGASRPSTVGEHGHRPGAHGGVLVPIDGDHYHVEAIVTAEGTLRLHVLGEDETRVEEVESQTMTGYARADDSTHSAPVTFEPSPQPGDRPGRTSLFVGRLPDGLAGRGLSVVVPSIRIAGRRLRFGFEMATPGHDETMPRKTVDDTERRLYLTPGGKYTEADIAANGDRTGSEKFAGFRASHDPNPRPGDRVCPITETKANPECTWVVGGKTYEFCCPPCVDEFVRRAKEEPDSIEEPGSYVAR